MIVAIRADASIRIGSGHVMRCLTLADALAARGAHSIFVCREHSGHLLDAIRGRGHEAIGLPAPSGAAAAREENATGFAAWSEVDWRADARETAAALAGREIDWLVVDHYALDARWESGLRAACGRVLVVDDLADRDHDCDILLDQSLTDRMETRYLGRTPARCLHLLGPGHAMVRPEFLALRKASLARRTMPALDRLLICMGGTDPDDETGKIVTGLRLLGGRWTAVDVVVGAGYGARSALESELARVPGARLHVQTPHMAELMTKADLAILSGGSITWEKCVLGLPSLVVEIAANQRGAAAALAANGAHRALGAAHSLDPGSYARALETIGVEELPPMTARAAAICDGAGARRVAASIEELS